MTIEDVAKAAGVSRATVSFVMNNRPGVSKDTRERVLSVAAEMGYDRSEAKQAGPKEERKIQFLAVNTGAFPVKDNISNTFFADLIRGLENTCRVHNSLLVVSTLNMDELNAQLKANSQNGRCMGTVLLGTNLTDEEMLRIGQSFRNLVVIDNAAETTSLNTVSINNYQGACIAARYLLNRGPGDFGYVSSESRLQNFEERRRGFLGTLRQSGIQPQDVEDFCVSQSVKDAQADFEKALAKRTAPLPGAIFCESDYIAIGVMRALMRAGISIPGDVRVVGFDDVPEAVIMQPELTTVHVNKEALGKIVGKRIFELINEPGQTPMKIRVDTELMVRGSA